MKKQKTRRCHDCGRPTNNYRCKKCWAKLREKNGYCSPGSVAEFNCGFVPSIKNNGKFV